MPKIVDKSNDETTVESTDENTDESTGEMTDESIDENIDESTGEIADESIDKRINKSIKVQMKTWEKNKQYFSSIASEENNCLDQPLSYNKEKNIYYYLYPK